MTTADDDVLLDIDVVELTHEGLRLLESVEVTPQTAWYYNRRREALAAAGLIGAYNPLQPRGKDGKWIEMLGWVRWLEDGKWKRGRVMSIGSDGDVSVKGKGGTNKNFTRWEARQKLYTTAKTKATLELPKPVSHEGANGFTQVGGQGGSNPGALYQVTDASAVKGNTAITPDMLREAIRQETLSVRADLNMLEHDTPATVMGRFTDNAYIIDRSTNRAYARLGKDLLWDLQTGEPIEPAEVFGLPETPRRYEVMGKLDLHEINPMVMGNVMTTATSMAVGKPSVDTKFYVKSSKSPDHARNEVLANDLYELAGVAVPNVSMGKDGSTVASEIVTGSDVKPLSSVISNPEVMSRIREDFVVDAWLANWDVAGMGLDNMLIVDDQPYRIDAGGALSYRAQGMPKGNKFGNEVTELESLTNPSINPQAAKVFGQVTALELYSGAQRVAAISPQQIINMVEAQGLDKSLSDKLIARRKYIINKFGLPDPHDLLEELLNEEPAVPTPAVPKTIDLANSHYDVKTKSMVPGKAPDAKAIDALDAYLSERSTALKPDQIATAFSQGYTPVIVRERSAWKVNNIEPSGYGGTYTLQIENLATGEKDVIYGQPGDKLMFGDTEDSNFHNYADVWGDYAAHVVSTPQSAAEIVNLSFDSKSGLDTRAVSYTSSLKAGDWLVRPGYEIAGKVVKANSGYGETVQIEMLDGTTSTVYVKPGKGWRTQANSSLFNAAFEALKAREAEAAKIDAAQASTDKLPSSSTPDDIALAKINAQTSGLPGTAVNSVIDDPDSQVELNFDPETGINKNLVALGDPVGVGDILKADEEKWAGQLVYARSIDTPKKSYTGFQPSRDKGLFRVVKVSDNNNGYVTVRDATGYELTLNKYSEIFPVEGDVADITNLQFKKDKTIAINGVPVGTWSKNDVWGHSSYEAYKIRIDPQFTVSGQEFRASTHEKAQMRVIVAPMLMPPGSGGAKPKSQKAIDLEQAVTADVQFGTGSAEVTDAGTAMTLLDGAKVEVGMYVISKTDGKIGQVSVIEQGTGYVKVKMPDGSVKGRAASTLSSAGNPETGAIPPYSPLYKGVKLSDGSQPFPSQGVLSGASDATIVMIKPDGNVRIVDSTGKFTWTSASKLTPTKTYAPAAQADLHASPGLAATVSTDAWKVAPKPGKTPYGAGPDGLTTIPQTSNAVEIYREFAHTRKLTRDGFVPAIGMHVRDADGKQHIISRISETFGTSNPSTVWTISVDDKYAKPVGRQPSRLWVDHAAELATDDGKPLPKISGIHMVANDSAVSLPSGSIIYEYDQLQTVQGRSIPMKSYFVALPNGTARQMNPGGPGVQLMPETAAKILAHKNAKKVAYVDELSDSMITFDAVEANNYGGMVINDLWVHSTAEGSLEALKEEIHQKKLAAGIVEPEKFSGTQAQLIRLPKPSTAPKSDDATTPSKPPPLVVRAPEKLKAAPVVGGSHSIGKGVDRLKEKIAAGGPGSRALYAMGDSDYIEDMAIRMQSTVDPDGNEYVEVRFKLLEERVDDLAERVITPENGKFGDWTQSGDMKSPTDLVKGDSIAVRISTTGTIKPEPHSYAPNATILDTPKKVGVTDKGFDAYEVSVAMASGAVGKMLLEKRPAPSVQTFEWDPLKPLPAKNFSGSVNPDAAKIGWSQWQSNAVGYESLGSKTMIDDQGRKVFDINAPNMTTVASHNGAFRMRYDAGEGGNMLVQLTHPASEKRQDTINHNGNNTSIRSTVNGEVTIRVRADDPQALDRISEMMSAAGIPPEAQGQPTGVQLRRMALNKVAKQMAPSYSHKRRPDVTGEDDASAKPILEMINKRVPNLGRPATMDDIMIRTTPEGRVQVVFSDDVARAAAANSGFDYAYHSFSYGGGSFTPSVLSNPAGTGLMSTDERWSSGITFTGASSKTDVGNDAANRVFFRIDKGKTKQLSGDNMLFLGGPAVMKLVDTYFSPSDHYGRRSYSNGSQYSDSTYASNNEFMIKRKIEPDLFGFVMVGSESARQQRIKDLKAQGVTDIGGRQLEDVIVVSGSKTVNELGELGMNVGTEIPITTIPGAPAP